jgi:hypothetical protein
MHRGYEEKYRDYDPDSFIIYAKRTVYKWWCVVYKPVYKLTHNGRWPEEKNPDNVYPRSVPAASPDEISELAEQAAKAVDNVVNLSETGKKYWTDDEDVDLTNVDENTIDRASEIMDRLAREAAEDEAKKQAEIEDAKKQAREKEKLDMIMMANKVDITPFIEEGKAHRAN